ncbi:hypothetical protein SM757_05800 [Azohydromonas lata]|uniref:Flagellar hook-length control protein FliK n=1 Tax=Azohydromonas lata TaxID=45677 RepID=A0ABU5IBV6_9BURK|nr:hypothetical protein [Azohydromonas lata]
MPVTTAQTASGLGDKAAALTALASAAGAVDLSPLGRGVAALASFGFPVVEIGPEGHEDPNTLELPPQATTPDQPAAETAPPSAARHIAQALAGALSLKAAEDNAEVLQEEPQQAPSGDGAPAQGARGDTATLQSAAPQAQPPQQAAGALLNAMLSAALTGQAAMEVRREGRPPAQMELEREADGHGGHRIARIRLRHQTEDGVIDVTAELALGAAFPGEHAPMNVDITGSGALGGQAAAQLNELRESLQARGMAANVRARMDD